MDVEELLQSYADGERDFSGVDLREASLFTSDGRNPILKDAILWNTICPNGEVVVQRCSIGSYQRRSLF